SRRLIEAIERGGASARAELARFFVVEARVIHDIYTQWLADTRRYLRDKGMPAPELAADEARIAQVSFAGRPQLVADRDAAWEKVQHRAEEVADGGSVGEAHELKELWRHFHDSQVDYISGLFDIVVRRYGEAALGEMYEGWVIGDRFARRYQRFDVSRFAWK